MKTPRFVFRIAGWKNRHIQNSQFVLILSFITGIMSGLAAVLLKNTVHYTFYIISSGFQFGRQNFLYLLLPLAEIVLTVVFVRLILKKEISHGISRILYAISKRNGIVEAHHTFSSMIGSTLTVAFGGSVGLEAPITTTGSAIGSNLGRLFRLNHKTLIVLIGCGAAGAIGGIFKAPIAAVVFAIEVLMIDLTLTTLIPLLISAVTGATVAYFLSGRNILFFFELSDPFVLKQIPLFLVLGIFTGLTSVYFSRTTEYIEDRFRNIGKHYIRIATGGTFWGRISRSAGSAERKRARTDKPGFVFFSEGSILVSFTCRFRYPCIKGCSYCGYYGQRRCRRDFCSFAFYGRHGRIFCRRST
jgi:CIC family chloride channel protein